MIEVKIRKPYAKLSIVDVEQKIKVYHNQITFEQLLKYIDLISKTIGNMVEWNGFLTEV